jgi:hypothetical protein
MTTGMGEVTLVARAIKEIGVSEVEPNGMGQPANLVDALFAIARSIDRLASVVTKALEGEEE